jgi:hypothetical protein
MGVMAADQPALGGLSSRFAAPDDVGLKRIADSDRIGIETFCRRKFGGKGDAVGCLERKHLARRMTEQGLIIRFDRPVAFADRFSHGFNIDDLNFTS